MVIKQCCSFEGKPCEGRDHVARSAKVAVRVCRAMVREACEAVAGMPQRRALANGVGMHKIDQPFMGAAQFVSFAAACGEGAGLSAILSLY